MPNSFSTTNTTKRQTPELPFEKIKNKVLGHGYELSLVLCADTLSRRLNRAFRGRDKPANVLSFPLSDRSGEIFINLKRADKELVLHFFIHGLLHLKGMRHGATMERRESELLRKFYNGKTNSSRH